MDKDIQKILKIILLSIIILGIPTGYFLWQYREKVLNIDPADVITLPEEETPSQGGTGTEGKDGVEKQNESIIDDIYEDENEEPDDTEPEEEPIEEEPDDTEPGEEVEADKKEGLIVDNSRDNPFDKNSPSVAIGPTTGRMGSKINPWDVSGFKYDLANTIHEEVGKMKRDPKRVLKGHEMRYTSTILEEKIVFNILNKEMEKVVMNGGNNVPPPESFKVGDKTYLVTTIDTWQLETVYNNPEGIMNEIKIQKPGFLTCAFLPEMGNFSYDYGMISVYFDTKKDKNIVTMALYNFVILTQD